MTTAPGRLPGVGWARRYPWSGGNSAPVAQLDRAGGFYPPGCGFDSCRGHHYWGKARPRLLALGGVRSVCDERFRFYPSGSETLVTGWSVDDISFVVTVPVTRWAQESTTNTLRADGDRYEIVFTASRHEKGR